MYFYIDCLQKQGKFGLLWMAAFETFDSRKRSIQFMVNRSDIERNCDDILKYTIEGRENSPKMNLYVTSNLLAGVTKILRLKAEFTLRDSAHLFINWGRIARSIMFRDVKIRKSGEVENPEELAASRDSIYLHLGHHSMPTVELHKPVSAKKPRGKQRISQAVPEALNGNELAEMLRIADDGEIQQFLVPQDITMREIPPISEAPEKSFGGMELQSLAPEVREALGEVRTEILQESLLHIPIVPEAMETADIPVPEVEKDTPVPEVEKDMPVPEVEKDLEAPVQPEPQVPVYKVHPPRDTTEIDIERVLEEMLEGEVSVNEMPEMVVRQETVRKARDTNLEFSLDKLKKNCSNFQNLMRVLDPREDTLEIPKKKIASADWLIPDELKIAAHLLPRSIWPPVRPQYTVELPFIKQRVSQTGDESMEVQQMRDGEPMEDVSMHLRSCLGSPTPTAPPREGRVRATPSPSPIGRGVQRTSTDLNIGEILEPIAETTIIDAALQISMEQEQVPLAVPIEGEQDILVAGPSPPKRPRKDADSELQSSSESSTIILENSEEKMRSSIAQVLRHKETVAFHDIAPPRTTTKRTAARLFSTLLDLEKRKVLLTEQQVAFGPISIHLVQPAT